MSRLWKQNLKTIHQFATKFSYNTLTLKYTGIATSIIKYSTNKRIVIRTKISDLPTMDNESFRMFMFAIYQFMR